MKQEREFDEMLAVDVSINFGILDTSTGYWMLDTGCWILDAGYWMLDNGYTVILQRFYASFYTFTIPRAKLIYFKSVNLLQLSLLTMRDICNEILNAR